jgi:cystathionine gamma-synthase
VLVESPSNPLLRVVDIAKICQLAREAGAVSVVDNTFLSPALQNRWRWALIWYCIHVLNT